MHSIICKHCGISFQPSATQNDFCCSGCEHVYQLIKTSGLDEYYERQDQIGRPLGPRPFKSHDFNWAGHMVSELESSPTPPYASFQIEGLTCMGCVWLVQRLALRENSILFAKCSLQTNTLKLTWKKGQSNLPALFAQLESFGYLIRSTSHRPNKLSAQSWATLLCSVFGLNTLLLSLPEILQRETPYNALLHLASLVFILLSTIVAVTQLVQRYRRAFAQKHTIALFFKSMLLIAIGAFVITLKVTWVIPIAWAFLLAILQLFDRISLRQSSD